MRCRPPACARTRLYAMPGHAPSPVVSAANRSHRRGQTPVQRFGRAAGPPAGGARPNAAPGSEPVRFVCALQRGRLGAEPPRRLPAPLRDRRPRHAVLRQEHARAGACRTRPCRRTSPRAPRGACCCAPGAVALRATLTSRNRSQVFRVSAVTAGLVYGAVKSTYLTTFKVRACACRACRDPAARAVARRQF